MISEMTAAPEPTDLIKIQAFGGENLRVKQSEKVTNAKGETFVEVTY